MFVVLEIVETFAVNKIQKEAHIEKPTMVLSKLSTPKVSSHRPGLSFVRSAPTFVSSKVATLFFSMGVTLSELSIFCQLRSSSQIECPEKQLSSLL